MTLGLLISWNLLFNAVVSTSPLAARISLSSTWITDTGWYIGPTSWIHQLLLLCVGLVTVIQTLIHYIRTWQLHHVLLLSGSDARSLRCSLGVSTPALSVNTSWVKCLLILIDLLRRIQMNSIGGLVASSLGPLWRWNSLVWNLLLLNVTLPGLTALSAITDVLSRLTLLIWRNHLLCGSLLSIWHSVRSLIGTGGAGCVHIPCWLVIILSICGWSPASTLLSLHGMTLGLRWTCSRLVLNFFVGVIE